MSDLINRRVAIRAIADLENCYNGFSDTYDKSYIIGVLEELPTVDAVPVIRCKDCYFFGTFQRKHYCEKYDHAVTQDGYCAWAERKEE